MAIVFMDGFDKYGPANTLSGSPASLMSGEWTSVSNSVQITTGLSATGYAVTGLTNAGSIQKSVPNLSRTIGGFRFSSSLASSSHGLTLFDNATAQWSISFNTAGTISIRTGAVGGTAIQTSTATISANSTHYIEWDVTIGASGAYQVWLDGVSILSGTGNTKNSSTDSFSTTLSLSAAVGVTVAFTVDDLYLFDSTGTKNNAVLLTNPRIETTFPTSDSSVQFSPGAEILGSNVARATATNAPGANKLALRKFTPSVNMTVNSIGLLPAATSATAKFKGVIYSDSAGSAGTLLSSGTEVVGCTNGTAMTLALVTPQALIANTAYWIGYITDTSVALSETDGNTAGFSATNTYTSGAPSSAPAMTGSQASWVIFGYCTGVASNWNEQAQQPPAGIQSYVTDSTSGHEDLYNFGALSVSPGFVYCVGMKGYCERSDTGARTVSLRTKSNGTDGGGSSTGQSPGTSFGWIGSYFEKDPQSGTPDWTGTTLNAATSGMKIDS